MTIEPTDNSSSEPAFVQRWLSSGSKVSRFAVMGALGCLAGAILGELWLWLAGNRGPQRPAQAVCLLIDCSGSMLLGEAPDEFNGQKLMEVKSAASQFIGRQDLARDSIAMVGFGSGVHPAAKLGGNAAQLNLSVQGLADGGSTVMHAALAAAAGELLAAAEVTHDPAVIRNILLFTDGQPDNQAAALEAAKMCRAQNIRIVAIGTGDADMAYLAQVTGDPALVFRTTSGNFGESFKQAEKAIYGPALMESGQSQSGFLLSLLRAAAWTALLAAGVSLALIAGQNLYLHRPALSARDAAIGIAGGLAAGAVAGMTGQLLFAVAEAGTHIPLLGSLLGWLMTGVGRVLSWAILGGLVGRGLAYFVPNLPPQRAWMAGGLGGGCAAVVFLIASLFGDSVGRLLGAALLGAFLGVAVALVETLFRQWWLEVRLGQKEVIQVNLGATPVRIGSDNRACTIYARGVRPLAAQYQVAENRVMFLDYATEISQAVEVGDCRTIGHVTVTVRGKTSADAPAQPGDAPSGTAGPAQAVRAAPPPPKPKSAPAEASSGGESRPAASVPAKPAAPPPIKAGGAILSAPPPPKPKSPPAQGASPRSIRPIPPQDAEK